MADPIDDLTGTVRPPTGEGRRCEFCGCQLSARGDVLEMSEKARALRTLQDRLAAEEVRHTATKAELTAAAARVAELQAALAPAAPKTGAITIR